METGRKDWQSVLTLPVFYHHGEGGQQSQWPKQVFVDGKELRHVATTPAIGEFSLDSRRHVVLGQAPDKTMVEVTTRMG